MNWLSGQKLSLLRFLSRSRSSETVAPTQKQILIYGAGHTGLLLAETIRESYRKEYKVVGFIDDEQGDAGSPVSVRNAYPLPVIGTFNDAARLRGEGLSAIVLAFTGPTDVRLERASELARMGYSFPSIVPAAVRGRWGVNLGDGVLVAESADICPGVWLMDHVIVGQHATLESCVVDAGAVLCPHSFVGANAKIGRGAVLGVGAKVLPGIHVADFAQIGPGAVLHRDVSERERYLKR